MPLINKSVSVADREPLMLITIVRKGIEEKVIDRRRNIGSGWKATANCYLTEAIRHSRGIKEEIKGRLKIEKCL